MIVFHSMFFFQNQLAKLPLAFQEFERLPKLSVKNAIHLLDFAYRMAIPNPSVLNKGRSNQTYGEINPLQTASIFDELKLTKEDAFMDMGSGIGQLVLLASLITPMQMSYGIELVETAANPGKAQQSWLSSADSCGKATQEVPSLRKGLPIFVSMILDRVTVMLINNHVFGLEDCVEVKAMKCIGAERLEIRCQQKNTPEPHLQKCLRSNEKPQCPRRPRRFPREMQPPKSKVYFSSCH
ncbi:hypothetical protein CAEBREN_10190 [Caenorhabditis brenneri]|uniref:Histone-lysine N-methyltransferase, H3 lysine-79 specific n=1 Tax=Caenorhabditis brenneri TaxID=135651 RepID=G0MW16_CAEBE|nr:hypothetical protein CAEBREN_10190 [Caenorhabditis brenneri]